MKCADLHSLFEASSEVMTPGEVASVIRASESYLCRLIAGDCLPCFCIGGHYRILKRDIILCLEQQTRQAGRRSRPPPQ